MQEIFTKWKVNKNRIEKFTFYSYLSFPGLWYQNEIGQIVYTTKIFFFTVQEARMPRLRLWLIQFLLRILSWVVYDCLSYVLTWSSLSVCMRMCTHACVCFHVKRVSRRQLSGILFYNSINPYKWLVNSFNFI